MAVQHKDSNAANALMNICQAEEILKETELIMKPYANWEEYLMPVPLSIAILGELAYISAGQGDFSINKNPPAGGFQYIKNPNSFFTCLMQVSNRGWEAFSTAHKNMDKIRILSMSVQEQMKTLVQTLFQETEVVKALLPWQLSSMKSIVGECKDLAQVVEGKFNDVIYLIQELLEACLSSKRGYERELEATRLSVKSLKLKQQAAKEAKEIAEVYSNSLRKKVEETYQDYRKAVDSIPTGWEAVYKYVVAFLIEVIVVMPLVVCKQATVWLKTSSGAEGNHESDARTEDDIIAMGNICCQSAQLVSLGKTLVDLIDEDGNVNMSLLYNEKDQTVKTSWTKQNAEELLQKIKKENKCSVKEEALEICNSIISVCQILADVVTKGKKIDNKTLKRKITSLLQKADHFRSNCRSHIGMSVFAPITLNMEKCLKKESERMSNAHFKVQQTKEMLKITDEEYHRSFENFKKHNQELKEVLNDMRKCKTKEVDFDTARKMLIKGLDALGRVKEQWQKMVYFFQMISSLIESCFSCHISELLNSAENVKAIANYSSNNFVIDVIYKQAFKASNVAHLVHMISETYTEVSSKHLMDKVSSLGRLISMDTSSFTFQTECTNLMDGCDDAQKAIKDLAIKKKAEFESNAHARMEKISLELKSVLPGITKAEKKSN